MLTRAATCAAVLVLLGAVGCGSFGKKTDFELKATADEAMRRQEYNRVVALDTEIVRRNPADYDATVQRAIALDRMGRASDALADYSRAIELSPGTALPRLFRANVALRLGQAEAARADLTALQGMQLSASDRVAAYTLHGTLEHLSKNYGKAVQLYGRAIELGRSDSDQHTSKHYRDALQNAAECYYRLGDFASAIGLLNESIQAKQRAGAAVGEDDHYTLGILYYFNGDFQKSKAHFTKVSPARRQQAAAHLNDPSFFEAM